jgi:protein-ribulosamine 3-kinase
MTAPSSPSPIPSWLEDALRAAGLPEPYQLLNVVSGGCINDCFAVETGTGPVFVKRNADAPPGFFAAEKAGLEALATARTSLVIPRVLGLHASTLRPVRQAHGRQAQGDAGLSASTPAAGRSTLILEWLEPARADKGMWETLGRGLAELHRHTGDAFGFPEDNYLGATPQPNGWKKDWGVFFVERRIGYLAGLLYRSGTLTVETLRVYNTLLEKLPGLLAHNPSASLLHGDLWNGNCLATTRGPALIDPAAHYGDRECDLAMMRLFGGFPKTVFDAYREAWPLEKGWEEREPLYRLYHLLNHQLLFGEPYGARALDEARTLRL